MVLTDGSNSTGGRAQQREQLLRRHGLPPSPPHVYGEAELIARRSARAAVVAARRARRVDKAAQVAITTLLTAEGPYIITEVHNSAGWSADRWVPWVFPSPLTPPVPISTTTDIEVPPSLYITPDTLPAFISTASSGWLDILERIAGFGEASPLGLQGAFSAQSLARIAASVALLHSAKGVRPRLRDVLTRIGVLLRPQRTQVRSTLCHTVSPPSALDIPSPPALHPSPGLPEPATIAPITTKPVSRGALYGRLAAQRHARAFGMSSASPR